MNLWKFSGSDMYITDKYPKFEIDEAVAGTIYIRWQDTTDKQFIKKVVELAGLTTITYAFGLWSGRSGLTYVSYFAFEV